MDLGGISTSGYEHPELVDVPIGVSFWGGLGVPSDVQRHLNAQNLVATCTAMLPKALARVTWLIVKLPA